jgi:pyruvate kinase
MFCSMSVQYAGLWRWQVLDRLRGVAGRKQRRIAYLLDTKGPEVRDGCSI